MAKVIGRQGGTRARKVEGMNLCYEKLQHLSFHNNFLCDIHSFDTIFPLSGVFEAPYLCGMWLWHIYLMLLCFLII